jgi:hypothetical protein
MTTALLQEHHLADLRSSGLSDETVRTSRCYSAQEPTVRELLGFGVGPGLVFEFPGTENDKGVPFVQVKPDTRPAWMNGAKYISPKGGGCRVYVPPTLAADRLANPRVPLYVTEGVKKALKACQEGLTCIALSGVDAWKDHRNGKSAPIPDLDKITWKGRTVTIVYDSDLATKPAVRFAEFRLARELRDRGADVYAVRLPSGPNGEKVGLDDYLCSHNVEAFCELEPERVEHPAKAADVSLAIPAAEVTREGDDFRFHWSSFKVDIALSRLRDAGDGVQSEITITREGWPIHWSRLNLASLSAREGLVTKLNRTRPTIPWRELLEEACRETTRHYRAGAPTVELVPQRGLIERRLVDKLVVDKDINVLFADGGSGKSLLALALAIAVRTGRTLPGGLIPRRHGAVLYLDWESCQEEHEERLAGLLTGLNIRGPVPIAYRKMVSALADDAVVVRQEVARVGAVLVIVDSLVPACGAEPETADATIRAFAALRSCGVASLVLAHVNKAQADARGPGRPFGSVYVQNLPRNVWELRKVEESPEETLTVGLYHRKTNRGRLLPPFGLQFRDDGDRTVIADAEVTANASLRERAGLSYNVKATLRSGARTVPQLAEELEASEDSVRKTLNRLAKNGSVVRIENAESAPGRQVRWGLPA